MGMIYSLLGYATQGRTDDPDPVTGLTSRDKYLIANSYLKVRKNPTESGVALLNTLFKNHPEYLQLFPFRDVPIKDLPENKRYQAHGNSIIYSFSSIIDALDQNDLLVTILTKIGESHVPRKATEKAFMDLKDSLIELFSPIFNEEEMTAWGKALDVSFTVMCKAIRDTLSKTQD
ncbi:hypothetical protein NQ314_012128 [Rhamnusium bicolor]|uniref:Globin domain-containing protein n=1 Tax=Rhamnusium bicolor TaxID=1586634 RepID=A0AAV8XEF4_9CUCU|nr:hypothetical protein NQ314_012128 [Rhamnusium bicolor]